MNELTTTSVFSPSSFGDIEQLARSFALSRMFVDGSDDFETTQAKIVTRIMYGMEIGLSPVAALVGVNIIKGRPVLGAGAIAAAVMSSGKVMFHELERNDDRCRLKWTRGNKVVGESSFSMDDAKRAGLVRAGGNWQKYPRNMLFARALTNGQRVYCPDLFGGSAYTAEELSEPEPVRVANMRSSEPKRPARAAGSKAVVARDAVDVERSKARRRLVDIIADLPDDIDPKRVQLAIKLKLDKAPVMTTAEDYREMAGIVRAFADEGTLSQWCDKMIGDVEDAEIVEPSEAVNATPVESCRDCNGTDKLLVIGNGPDGIVCEPCVFKANERQAAERSLRASWSEFCEGRGIDKAKLAIVTRQIRRASGIDDDGDWGGVAVAEIQKIVRMLAVTPDAIAVAIDNDWA